MGKSIPQSNQDWPQASALDAIDPGLAIKYSDYDTLHIFDSN